MTIDFLFSYDEDVFFKTNTMPGKCTFQSMPFREKVIFLRAPKCEATGTLFRGGAQLS